MPPFVSPLLDVSALPPPSPTLRIVKGLDDLVEVYPLRLADLAGDRRSRGPDSFAEWLQHRPERARKKLKPTTQGDWVRNKESQANAVLKAFA